MQEATSAPADGEPPTKIPRAKIPRAKIYDDIRLQFEYARAIKKGVKANYGLIRIKPEQHVFFIGDLHGDYELLINGLLASGLVDASLRWVGRNSIFVQLGDILDSSRGDPSYEFQAPGEDRIVSFLWYLKKQAKRHGGNVFWILGNHDFYRMFALYDSWGRILSSRDSSSAANSYVVNRRGEEWFLPNLRRYMSEASRTDFSHQQCLSGGKRTNEKHRCIGRLFFAKAFVILRMQWEDAPESGLLVSHGMMLEDFDSTLSTVNRLLRESPVRQKHVRADKFAEFINTTWTFAALKLIRIKSDFDSQTTFSHFLTQLLEHFPRLFWSHMKPDNNFRKTLCENAIAKLTAFGFPVSCQKEGGAVSTSTNTHFIVGHHFNLAKALDEEELKGNETKVVLGGASACGSCHHKDLLILLDTGRSRCWREDPQPPEILKVTRKDHSLILH